MTPLKVTKSVDPDCTELRFKVPYLMTKDVKYADADTGITCFASGSAIVSTKDCLEAS
jgi:hypothetical protein